MSALKKLNETAKVKMIKQIRSLIEDGVNSVTCEYRNGDPKTLYLIVVENTDFGSNYMFRADEIMNILAAFRYRITYFVKYGNTLADDPGHTEPSIHIVVKVN